MKKSCPAVQLEAVQLTVVGLYFLGKLCIYVDKKYCKHPRAEKKAESREHKEYLADKCWQAEVEKLELQLRQKRQARKAVRAERAKKARPRKEHKVFLREQEALMQRIQEQRELQEAEEH